MSARLLRAEDARRHAAERGEAGSRGGFYALARPRLHVAAARCRMRHRWAGRRDLASLVIASTVPLYRLVKQEYIPTDVDEAEFEVSVNGPEGIEPAPRWTRRCGRVEPELRATPGVRDRRWPRPAAASSAASTRATSTCASRRTRSARSRSARLWRETAARATRWRAFRGNYTPARRDAGGPPAACASSATCALACATSPSFNIGGGNFEIDFVLRGPDLEQLAELRRGARATRASELGRHRRRRHHAAARQARAARRHRPRARGRPRRRHRGDRHRAAADGGRRRRGLALPRPHRQRGLRRAAAPRARSDRGDLDTISRLYVSRQGGAAGAGAAWCGSTTWCRSRRAYDRLAHRPLDRQREVRLRAGVAPGLRPGRPHRGAAQARWPR